MPPPDRPARLYILQRLLADQPTAPGLDMAPFASATSGFSGADLLNVVETAIDASGTSSAPSALTPIITGASPPPPTNDSPPVVTGRAEEGQTLVASTGSWTGLSR